MKTQFSKSIFLVLFSLLQLFHFGFSQDIIPSSCKSAAKTDSRIDYKLCIKSLKSHPDSKDATLEELVSISIEQSKAVAENIKTVILGLMKGGAKWESCLKDCLKLYSEAASNLNSAMEAVKMGDYETAKTDINSAMDAPLTCGAECKKKNSEISVLTKINDGFLPLIATSLAFVNMDH